jgi:hypothetical protein
MKTILTFLTFFAWSFCYSQSNQFKAQIFIEDSLPASGGMVIFPLTKDTVPIGSNDTALINLNNPNHRIFYFLWSGWKSKIFRFNTNETSDEINKIIVPDTLFYQQFEEKNTCPVCLKTKSVIPVIYGMPTRKMFRNTKSGKYRLGGCIITQDNPKYYCKADDFEF